MSHVRKRLGKVCIVWPMVFVLVWGWFLPGRTAGAADDPKLEGDGRLSPAGVEQAIRELNDPDKKVRRAAVALMTKHHQVRGQLAKQHLTALRKALVILMGDDEVQVRRDAVEILAHRACWPGLDPPEAQHLIPAVIPLLKDPDARVRIQAAIFLWETDAARKQEAVAIWCQAFQDKSHDAHWLAAIALVPRDATKAAPVPFLVEQLEKKTDGGVASEFLGNLGLLAKAAQPQLIQHLEDKEPDVRLHAAVALVRIDANHRAKVMPVLLELLKDETWGTEAARGLAVIGAPAKAALPQLHAGLKEVNETTPLLEKLRQVAFRYALAKIDPEHTDAVTPLARMLKNADVLVRANIIFTLGQIGPPAKAAIPALIEAASTLRPSDPDFDFRYIACLALGRIGPNARAAVPYLMGLLKADEYVIRREAAEALKKIQGSAQGERSGC